MPDRMPTANDLVTYITGLGVLDDTGVIEDTEYAAVVEAAAEELERATGYVPFLSGADSTRYFDPPGYQRRGQTLGGGRHLELGMGLVSLTSLYVDYSPSSAGTLLTANVDYFLEPRNAAAQGKPYEAVDFVLPQWGDPRSVAITGAWGYAATVPADAWRAVLHYAAHLLRPALVLQNSQARKRWETAGLKVEYDDLSPIDGQWLADFARMTRPGHYQRVSL